MKIKDALQKRIPRVRKTIWANLDCYLRLPLFHDGTYGPWAELYDEYVQSEVLDIEPGSQKIPTFAILEEDGFEEYSGKISEFEQKNFARGYAEK